VISRAREILGALSEADIAGGAMEAGDAGSYEDEEEEVVFYGKKKKSEAANRIIIKEIQQIDTKRMSAREVLRAINSIQGIIKNSAAGQGEEGSVFKAKAGNGGSARGEISGQVELGEMLEGNKP